MQAIPSSSALPVLSRRLNVLHYIGIWVPGTGVDTFVLHLAAAQRHLGVDCHIGCDAKGRQEFLETAKTQQFPCFLFPEAAALDRLLPRKLRTASELARRTTALALYLLRHRIDVIHVHAAAVSALEAHLASALTGVPIVVTHHATIEYLRPMWTRQTDVILWLEKLRTKHVVCPYPRAAEELRELGVKSERLFVVPFCADEEKFNGAIKLPEPGGEFRLLTVSRLVEGKGHVHLLEGLAKVRSTLPQVRLTIVGDGPARASIEETIARLGLGDIVTMAGHVHNAAVPDLMRQAHVVVLPSYMPGETFPVCLLEAMCLGMPCIGTRWFGIPDIIVDGETGFVVEPRDADGLARAIAGLGQDLGFFAQASQKAAQRAQELYTGAAVARRYRELYDQATP